MNRKSITLLCSMAAFGVFSSPAFATQTFKKFEVVSPSSTEEVVKWETTGTPATEEVTLLFWESGNFFLTNKQLKVTTESGKLQSHAFTGLTPHTQYGTILKNSTEGYKEVFTAMGLGLGVIGVTTEKEDNEVAARSGVVRLECAGGCVPSQLSRYHVKGVPIIADIECQVSEEKCKEVEGKEGSYTPNGVKSINPTAFAREVRELWETMPYVYALEILNEPGGPWFWGTGAESQTNASTYAIILKDVHEEIASHEKLGVKKPLILASYDGGHNCCESESTAWGAKVFNEVETKVKSVGQYIDGVTVHPYAQSVPTKKYTGPNVEGTTCEFLGKEGNNCAVAAAHEATGKPVFITEMGWAEPEATKKEKEEGKKPPYTDKERAEDVSEFTKLANFAEYVSAITFYKANDNENPKFGFHTTGETEAFNKIGELVNAGF